MKVFSFYQRSDKIFQRWLSNISQLFSAQFRSTAPCCAQCNNNAAFELFSFNSVSRHGFHVFMLRELRDNWLCLVGKNATREKCACFKHTLTKLWWYTLLASVVLRIPMTKVKLRNHSLMCWCLKKIYRMKLVAEKSAKWSKLDSKKLINRLRCNVRARLKAFFRKF